jgi:hypothetical protein
VTEFWWCLAHKKVEPGDDRCAAANALGPYPTAADAAAALERVAERNEAWKKQDEQWDGDDGDDAPTS